MAARDIEGEKPTTTTKASTKSADRVKLKAREILRKILRMRLIIMERLAPEATTM